MTKEDKKQENEKAHELGKKAFHSEITCAPCLDKEYMKILKGKKVGESIQLAENWIRGWTTEHLKDVELWKNQNMK